jgi:hypothetical protein
MPLRHSRSVHRTPCQISHSPLDRQRTIWEKCHCPSRCNKRNRHQRVSHRHPTNQIPKCHRYHSWGYPLSVLEEVVVVVGELLLQGCEHRRHRSRRRGPATPGDTQWRLQVLQYRFSESKRKNDEISDIANVRRGQNIFFIDNVPALCYIWDTHAASRPTKD